MANDNLLPPPYQPAPLRRVPLISDEKGNPYDDPTRTTGFDDEQEPISPEDEAEEERKRKLLEQALDDFKTMELFERPQRARELEDLKFDRALPEDQWPDHILNSRSAGKDAQGQYLPDRPCLTIPKLDQPVQQIMDEARRARLGIVVKPEGSKATKDGAWVRQGLYRKMEQRCHANEGRLWALDRAVKCGRGAYRITKEWVTDPDPKHPQPSDFDQAVAIKRILNQHSVYLDPFAQMPDWSDGERAFITSDIPEPTFKRKFPKAKLTTANDETLSALGDAAPGWIDKTSTGQRTFRVAEYFYVTHTHDKIYYHPDLGFLSPDQAAAPEFTQHMTRAKERPVDIRTVHWAKITANEVLEEEIWDGKWIPIIPVIGKEYNVNGDRCWKGVISNSKDSQRMFNYTSSGAAEASGLLSRAPWILAEGQDEGYKAMWNEPNNYRYLIYKPTTFDDKLVGPPTRNFGTVDLSAFVELRAQADQDIQATTARFNTSLGRADNQAKSGISMKILREQGESSTSIYLDNLAQVSMWHEARVVLDLFTHVFDAEGRIERVLGDEENDEQSVMLNKPFYHGPNKQPIAMPPAPQGVMGRVAAAIPGLRQPQVAKDKVKHYNMLDGAEYGFTVEIGRSWATQRDEDNYLIGSLLEAFPGAAPRIADILASQINSPVAKKLEKRLKPPDVKDDAEETDQPTPEQIQELMTQHEALAKKAMGLEQALTQKKAEAEAKAQADIEIAQINADTKIKVAQIDAESRGVVAMAQIDSEEFKHLVELEADRVGLQDQMKHDFVQSRLDEFHQRQLAAQQAAAQPVEPAPGEATAP